MEFVKRESFIGFEGTEIKYVGNNKPRGEGSSEIISEGDNIVVTAAFIDSYSHIGMVRSGEPDKDEEANERMNSVYPLVDALHSIYMDDPAFNESVESGVLYSTVLPGSGNIIAGKAVLIRNFVDDIGHAYIMDLGIKAALGYNPRTTTDWKGDRPSTRIGSIAMLRDNFIKAKKMQGLLDTGKKIIEVEPLAEVFIDILSNKNKLMVHLHKEDDVMVLIQLAKEFGIKVVANHCMDVHRESVFTVLKAASIPIVYGPMDSFP
jgi:imidazolonepropionase-like amidohydrolase